MNKNIPWLNLYAQPAFHDDAFVAGNRAALLLLRDLIDAVLRQQERQEKVADDTPVQAAIEMVCGDGEGYLLHLCLVDDKTMGALRAPYTEEMALDHRKTAIDPYDL